MRAQALGREVPEGGAHSRILTWEIPWTGEPDGVAMRQTQLCSGTEHAILQIRPCCCKTQAPFILKLYGQIKMWRSFFFRSFVNGHLEYPTY